MIRDIFRSHSLELLDGLPTAIFIVDTDGCVRYANQESERMWGRAATQDMRFTGAFKLMTMDRKPLRLDQSHVKQTLEDGKTRNGTELIIVRQDGSEVYVSSNVSAILDDDGRIAGAVVCCQDITERQLQNIEKAKLVDELNRRADELAQANSAKDHFLAALSHELRTPLAPVLMTASMLKDEPGLTHELREDLKMIQRNVELEARLIDDLLDVTRISRGKLELRAEAVDAHALLQEASDTCCRSDFNIKQQKVKFDLQAKNSTLWADAPRLQQIFWNLLKNAVKFTPEGGSITVRTRNEGQGVNEKFVLEVSDSGKGIAPEALPHIFNAFEQGSVDVTRRFGGLGLGLAISSALTKMHHGAIAASSDGLGKGATFTVKIPVAAKEVSVKKSADDLLPDSRPLRILLVEDHPSTANVMARLLKSQDHQVTVAHTVEEAMNYAATGDFDLLVSDLGLPDGSGFDLMKSLKKQMKGIALSGYGMEEDVASSQKAGFDMHLTKPVDFRKLQTAIMQVTGRS